MAIPQITRLINYIRLHVGPGALDAVIQAEMFEVLQEFFTVTNVWQEALPVTIIVNQTSYQLIPTGSASIFRLMWVADPNNLPVKAFMDIPGTLTLDQPVTSLPTNPYIYSVQVAEKLADPTDNQGYPQFPQWIADKYYDDFVDGILGRLMSQAAKPYSNQQLAVYHLRRWRAGMAKCKVDVLRRNVYGAQAWMYPQQFRTFPRHGGGGGSGTSAIGGFS